MIKMSEKLYAGAMETILDGGAMQMISNLLNLTMLVSRNFKRNVK